MTDLEGFVNASGRDDAVAAVRKRIDKEGITYIYFQFASVTGRIMGKGVPAKHWETIAEKGFQLVYGSTANLFTDRHGNYIGELTTGAIEYYASDGDTVLLTLHLDNVGITSLEFEKLEAHKEGIAKVKVSLYVESMRLEKGDGVT